MNKTILKDKDITLEEIKECENFLSRVLIYRSMALDMDISQFTKRIFGTYDETNWKQKSEKVNQRKLRYFKWVLRLYPEAINYNFDSRMLLKKFSRDKARIKI